MFIGKKERRQLAAHSWATEYAISLLRRFHLGIRSLFYKHFAATRLLLAPLAFLILFSSFQAARAQSIAVDNASSAAGPASDVTSLTWSHTVGSGSNRYLIVGISLLEGQGTVSSVNYGGAALTFVGARDGDKLRMEMWQRIAPASGTASIVVNVSSAERIVAGAVSFTGVSQSTPHGSFVSANQQSSTASVTVSSTTGELVIDTLAVHADVNSATAGGSQTERWNKHTGALGDGNEVIGAGSTKAGASSVTMSWTLGDSKAWAIGAISLKPALAPNVGLTKSVSPSGSQPPGTDLAFTVSFSNTGSASASSFVITDAIPANTDFKVGSVTNNLGTTGLTVVVAYSNNGGSTYAYTPVSGGGGAPGGYDRNVTNIRWTFTGNLSQTSPNNTGSVSFTTRIR